MKSVQNTIEYNVSFNLEIETEDLDLEKGLKVYGNNIKLYEKVLQMYIKDVRSLLKTIESVDKKWLNGYRYIVHGIKEASIEIFADKTAEMATHLENAAFAEDMEYIGIHNTVFIKSTNRFLLKLEAMLANT